MKTADILLRAAVSPAWGFATWMQKRHESEPADGKGLYGGVSVTSNGAFGAGAFGAILIFSLIAIVPIMLYWYWIAPMIKAFGCGNSQTSLGGSGLLWGLLIFFTGPIPLGMIYHFKGTCEQPSGLPTAAPQQQLVPQQFASQQFAPQQFASQQFAPQQQLFQQQQIPQQFAPQQQISPQQQIFPQQFDSQHFAPQQF